MSFDLTKASPDVGHEGIRRAVVEAIANLDYTTENTDVTFSLVDLLFGMAEDAIARHDALQERVAALEQAAAVLPGPDASG